MNKKNLIVFDADSLCYLGSKDDSLQQIIDKVDYKIEEVLKETNADYYVLLVSRGKYFRHNLSAKYKANRVYGVQPWVQVIKEYLITKYKAVHYNNVEADDVCSWLLNKELCIYENFIDTEEMFINESGKPLDKVNKILVAKDKDLLYSIPGRHFNFSKKLDSTTWGTEWIETSEAAAHNFVKSQMIIGDVSDGVSGLYNKGKAFWNKLSQEVVPSWGEILQLYIIDYGEAEGIFTFQTNYRLLHMLTTDVDFMREVGYIPKLPEFQKIIKPDEEIIMDF